MNTTFKKLMNNTTIAQWCNLYINFDVMCYFSIVFNLFDDFVIIINKSTNKFKYIAKRSFWKWW